ncbi:MAG: hypothetical protein MJZ98_02205 [Paludibacteraceae bacterium]|nr:hypothetical protein [Paludibacteraceae bacterium]
MNIEYIQVLWVEDDPEVRLTFPMEAAKYGLELVAFDCWDDAEAALKRDHNRWSAIILDAKCKHHKDSVDNATRFLINATNAITNICHGQRFIPWYVLSGQAETDIKELIPETRNVWDGDWEKTFYDKNTDRDLLFRRIRYTTRQSRSADLKIHEMYKTVFEAITNLGIDTDADIYLTDLLSEIHFPELDNKDYNDKYKKVRQIVEYIFRSMIEKGLLPRQKKINLKCSNLILSGYPVTYGRDENKTTVVEVNHTVFPKIIQDNMIHMIHTAGSDVHTSSNDDDENKHLQEYLKNVGNTSYLLKSYALQLCDVILWYQEYNNKHSNVNGNTSNWEIKDKIKFSQLFR